MHFHQHQMTPPRKQQRRNAMVMASSPPTSTWNKPNKRCMSHHIYLCLLGVCFLVSTTFNVRLNLETSKALLLEQQEVVITPSHRELLQIKSIRGARRQKRIAPTSNSKKKPIIKPPSTNTKTNKKQSPRLDFFIAGFPKCGTTTLLYAFGKHNETSISNVEKCSIQNPKLPDGSAVAKLDEALRELEPSPSVKRGIKCPTGIKTPRGLERLAEHSPNTRIVIGVRHPVLYFQSHYNYRITEIHDRKLKEKIPPIESLVGSEHEWKGVSTDNARFELFLMQLGKANMTRSEMDSLLGRSHMSIKPNPFSIMIYSLGQLEDTSTKRSALFRSDMQDFLGLKNPIPPFGHENLNHFVGKKAHKETIDICDGRYRDLRALLVKQGAATQKWIRSVFLNSPDVFVGGDKQHFLSLLSTWGKDPCVPKDFMSATYK